MPFVSWGFLGVWAARGYPRPKPRPALIADARGGLEPPTPRFAVARLPVVARGSDVADPPRPERLALLLGVSEASVPAARTQTALFRPERGHGT